MEWILLRQAARRVAAQPGFALAAVIILAIGIGANATTFSIVTYAGVRRPGISRLGHSLQAQPTTTGRLPDACGNRCHPGRL
ncbi:MAG: hypothetical protein F4018_02985 [Acidobacteria bacterium]|nr:hypothetical protein [Acidobacteriota bacterium]MYK87377.1 hypothetical protein [Acidobacteriota bacterium]